MSIEEIQDGAVVLDGTPLLCFATMFTGIYIV